MRSIPAPATAAAASGQEEELRYAGLWLGEQHAEQDDGGDEPILQRRLQKQATGGLSDTCIHQGDWEVLLVTARGSLPCRIQRPAAVPSLGKLQRRAFRFQSGLAWLQAEA